MMRIIPPLKKKNRSLADVGPDSMAAALNWDKLTGQTVKRTKAFGDQSHTGVMIALFVPPEVTAPLILQPLDLPAGSRPLPPSEFHITLAMLGQVGSMQIEPEDLADIIEEFAGTHAPIHGEVGGVGRFLKSEEDGTNAFYASFDSPELTGFRQDLLASLESKGIPIIDNHGFTPHITLAYIPEDAPTPQAAPIPALPIIFDTITAAWGGNYLTFPLGTASTVKRIVFSQVKEWMARHKADPAGVINTGTSLKVFKDANGEYMWVAFSSNAYRDRDKEIVSLKALANDCDRADAAKEYGPLRFWHIPGLDIGDCTFNMTYGNTLVELGTFRYKEIGQYLEKAGDEYQISLGFHHPMSEPDENGVFHTINRYERSLVPKGRAANALTGFVTLRKESTMSTLKEKLNAFRALVADPELADAILAGTDGVQKSAEEMGLDFSEKESQEADTEKAKGKKPMPPKAEDATTPAADETEGEMTPEEEADMEEEEEKDFGGPYLGDMNPDEFARVMGSVFAEALSPVITRLKSLEEQGGRQKDAADATQAETAKTIAGIEKQMAALGKQLKELQSDTPPAAGTGYVASESEDTLQADGSRLKDSAPHADPLSGFADWVTQGTPFGQ